MTTTPTPTPATPTAAAATAITVVDVTPAESRVHQATIPAALVAGIVAQLDASAPAGKTVRQIFGSADAKGDLVLRITYAP